MNETTKYYCDGSKPTGATVHPLRARLENMFSEMLRAVDEHTAAQAESKPEPEMTDDQIIAELEKLSRINPRNHFCAFYGQAAKRFTVALAEHEELEQAVLDWYLATQCGVFSTGWPVTRMLEIADRILTERKGGNQ
jgi:hypothetical protein